MAAGRYSVLVTLVAFCFLACAMAMGENATEIGEHLQQQDLCVVLQLPEEP
jgi:hypothetical protein